MIDERNKPRTVRRLTPLNIGLIVAGILILAFALWTAASTRRDNPDKLSVRGWNGKIQLLPNE